MAVTTSYLKAKFHIRLLPFVYEIEILWKFGLNGDEKRVAPPDTMRGYIFFNVERAQNYSFLRVQPRMFIISGPFVIKCNLPSRGFGSPQ